MQHQEVTEASQQGTCDPGDNHAASDVEGTNHSDRAETDPTIASQLFETLLQAQIGQTLGPYPAECCSPVDSESKGQDGIESRGPSELVVVEGGQEVCKFLSVGANEEPHLEIQKRGKSIYVKVLRIITAGTMIRGHVIKDDQRSESQEGTTVTTELPNTEPHAREDSSTGQSPTITQNPSVRGSPPARGSPPTRESPTTRGCPSTTKETSATRGSLQFHPEMTLSGEDEIPNTSKKCPNCSVCFRNISNLEAHQIYYCTGRGRVNLAPNVSENNNNQPSPQTPSPKIPSRNSSRNSAEDFGKSSGSLPVHVCQLCQSSFMSRQNCESHMLILHCSEHVPMCKFCNFVAQSWDILKEHVFSHVKVEKHQRGQDHDDSRTAGNQSEMANSPQSGLSELESGRMLNVKSTHHRIVKNQRERNCGMAEHRRVHMHNRDEAVKRKLRESEDMASKRIKLSEALLSPSDVQVKGDCLTEARDVGECSPPPAFRCRSCNICFRSRENFLAHKQYYCKQRLSEAGNTTANSREGSPDCNTRTHTVPNRTHTEAGDGIHSYEDRVHKTRPECDRIPKLCPAPMMYMSPVVPSAMLVGGTQLISPSGAHVISPIFLLTPPVAIPMAGVEPSVSMPNITRKRKIKVDSPLDLSRRASPDDRGTTPSAIKTEPIDRLSPEEAHLEQSQERRSPPRKAFICVRCGTSFWKSSTLLAHEQLYCSHLNRNNRLASPTEPHNAEQRPLHHSVPSSSSRTSVDSESDVSNRCPTKPLLSEAVKAPGIKVDHLQFPRNGNLCNMNDYLEKIHARNCPEKQLLEGLRICSGCGVAFRKLESLEIHQKFYCQIANSLVPMKGTGVVRRGPSTASHQPPRKVSLDDAQSKTTGQANEETQGSSSQGNCKDGHRSDAGDVTSDGLTESLSDELSGAQRQEDSSETDQQEKIASDTPEKSSPHEHSRDKMQLLSGDGSIPTGSVPGDLPPISSSQGEAVGIKMEESDSNCGQNNKMAIGDSITRQSSPQQIQIKSEPPSPTPSGKAHVDMVTKLQTNVNGKLPSSVSVCSAATTSRPTPSVFPPGSKACKSCNISFRSLSTFIAHKKYYCSSTASLRSNVAS